MKKFKTVAIYSTYSEKRIEEIAHHCGEVLSNLDVEVLLTENLEGLAVSKNYKVCNERAIIRKADLIISIGGDGTLLGCARKYGLKGLPLLVDNNALLLMNSIFLSIWYFITDY